MCGSGTVFVGEVAAVGACHVSADIAIGPTRQTSVAVSTSHLQVGMAAARHLFTSTLTRYALHLQAGMDAWHHENNVQGITVELHGNIRHLVCPECHHLLEVDESDLVLLRKRKTRQCQQCGKGTLRFKIMLYDDEEAESITPENVWDQLETDLETADLIVWVGMSFEQVSYAPIMGVHCGSALWESHAMMGHGCPCSALDPGVDSCL